MCKDAGVCDSALQEGKDKQKQEVLVSVHYTVHILLIAVVTIA